MNEYTPSLSSDDHPSAVIPDTPLWSENYAFNCFEPDAGIGIMLLLGRWWADPRRWREAFQIALPGGRRICVKNFGSATNEGVASASMFRIEVVKPGTSFRLSYDGPALESHREELLAGPASSPHLQRLKLDILFTGTTPVWDMNDGQDQSGEIAGSLHIEQVGLGTGSVQFGDELFAINNAFMNRDHSRGPRDIGSFSRHCWSQGWFPALDLSFNLYCIELEDGNRMSKASLSRDNTRFPAEIRSVGLASGIADEGASYQISLGSEIGEWTFTRHLSFESILISFVRPWELYHGRVPNHWSGTTFEEGSHWRCGEEEGIGWSERAFIEP